MASGQAASSLAQCQARIALGHEVSQQLCCGIKKLDTMRYVCSRYSSARGAHRATGCSHASLTRLHSGHRHVRLLRQLRMLFHALRCICTSAKSSRAAAAVDVQLAPRSWARLRQPAAAMTDATAALARAQPPAPSSRERRREPAAATALLLTHGAAAWAAAVPATRRKGTRSCGLLGRLKPYCEMSCLLLFSP